MSNKVKGGRTERELLMIFSKNGWRCVRVAGSGVHDESPCDLIAGRTFGKKRFAVEAKSSKKSRIYIKKEQINDFILFAELFGLKPAIAVRFNYEGWLFLKPQDIEDSGKNWVVSLENARKKGKRFSQFFG